MFLSFASTLHLNLLPAAHQYRAEAAVISFDALSLWEVLPLLPGEHRAGALGPAARIRIAQNPVQSEKNPSATRDFGTHGRAFLRVAGRRTGENRWVRALYRAGDVTVRHTGRVARVLWLEVTGFLFLCLAVIGAGAAFREYRHYARGEAGFGKVAVAAAFTFMFVYFGVNSFWRSRSPRK
jgi:hypothetical protein